MNAPIRGSSAAAVHYLSHHRRVGPMIARRFTIICLATALFGMFFASLVVRTNGPDMAGLHAQQMHCAFLMKSGC